MSGRGEGRTEMCEVPYYYGSQNTVGDEMEHYLP